jgi:hypothetical protein
MVFATTAFVIFKKFRFERNIKFLESMSVIYLAFLAKPISTAPRKTPARRQCYKTFSCIIYTTDDLSVAVLILV